MERLLFKSIVIFCVLVNLKLCVSDELIGVVVLFRHGDRAPTGPYPTDPYGNRSYWPVNWGQLTSLGKKQHYELGQWFRNRYDGFLPRQYDENDIYVRTTDIDRTHMSAQANLAGLYPPEGNQMWSDNIRWQPIPVHTVSLLHDAVLASRKPCPKYDRLAAELANSEYFQKINNDNKELYKYLSQHTGENVTTIHDVNSIYSTLNIENIYNFTLPNWTKEVFPNKLYPFAAMHFAVPTFTQDLARLASGPWFNEIIDYFQHRIDGEMEKFRMYSAHDGTVANILNSMGAFEWHTPPYASTVIFELRQTADDKHYVNLFYKNSTYAMPIKLETCDLNCRIDDFIETMEPVTVNLDQWEKECNEGVIFAKSNKPKENLVRPLADVPVATKNEVKVPKYFSRLFTEFKGSNERLARRVYEYLLKIKHVKHL